MNNNNDDVNTSLTRYNDVCNVTTEEYFEGNIFSIDAFNKKYRLNEDETYVGAIKRVCDYVASVEETDDLKQYWSDRWFDEIYNDWWHPAGSIMQGAGSGKNISLANCSTTNLGSRDELCQWDNLESIIRNTAYTVAKSAAFRQGQGIDFSSLRPSGMRVNNSANYGTGSIHWMKYIDSLGYYVGQCLHPETDVLTEHGYKTIKELVETKYDGLVYGINGPTRVINWFKNPSKRMYKLTTEYGDTLTCSEDHEIYIHEKDSHKLKPLKDITTDDYVICGRNTVEVNVVDYIEIPEFKYLRSTYNSSNRLKIPNKIPSVVTPDLGYILGIIYGDGCFTGDIIEIAFSNDWDDIKTKFSECMSSTFDAELGKDFSVRSGDGDCDRISLGKWYYKFFEFMGCKKEKAGYMRLPDIIKKSPKNVAEAFFAGLMDSDGYNSTSKQNIQIMLIDKQFLEDVKKLMQSFGYVLRLAEKDRHEYRKAYSLSLAGCTSAQMLNSIPSVKIQSCKLNPTKDLLKTAFTAKQLGIKYNDFPSVRSDGFLSDKIFSEHFGEKTDLYVQKIRSIEYIGESDTYDITVDDENHIFCANSIFVSNSGRIPALLFSLRVGHPDVIEFIKSKIDFTTIQNANISVQCTDDFYKAVEKDEEWEMSFTIPEVKKGDKIYVHVHSAMMDAQKDEHGYYTVAQKDRKEEVYKRTYSARGILELIAKGMCDYAEPGVQNIDIAIRESNSDYVYDPLSEYNTKICSTNACSEQYLSPDSLCILSSLNVGKFSTSTDVLKKQLEKIAYSMNRFLDNVNECELVYHTYATPHQKLAIEHLRRTGAGFTNLEAWLIKSGFEYGEENANDAAAEFQKWYNYYLYKSSIDIGKEKGSFKSFNREKLEKSPFIQRMIGLGLEFDALRNITCSSIAPTGSLSLQFRGSVMSYGIEKGFGPYYWKRTRISGKYEYYFNVPRIVREIFENHGVPIPINSDTIKDTWDGKYGKPVAQFIDDNMNKIGINLHNSTDLDILKKLDLMCKIQKWVDSSISTTYMLPESANWKDVYDFILLGWHRGLKSIAAFPDRKMYGIVSYIPFKELAQKLISDGKEIHAQNFTSEEFKQLSLTIPSEMPKRRPKEIEGDITIATAKGKKFLFFVGIVGGKPFEMFGGELPDEIQIKDGGKGAMIKVIDNNENKYYSLKIGDIVFENFGSYFTPHEEAMFRAVSYMLQNGDSVDRVAKYLRGCSHREGISSLYSAARRVLLRYNADNHGVITHIGRKCPVCDSANVYSEAGCVKCGDCEWSKCE